MTNVIDWLLDLFRDPVRAQEFITDPARSMAAANVSNVTAAQVQAVAATVAPAAIVGGGGDPVFGLQQAVAQTHGIAFAPQRQTDLLSGNDTRLLSPETNMSNTTGEDSQQGVGNFDLDFGDITLGDKTSNTATNGGVVNTGTAGDIDATHVDGDGNVVGDDNENVSTGDIDDSNVNIGEDNDIDDSGDQTAGGDIVSDNEGPVINDVDMSGGNGGGGGGDGGGGLIGIGNDGGDATGGAGGSGGGIVIVDNDTASVGGNQTTVEGDASGGVSGGISAVDNSGQDNSVDSSVDNSGQDNSVDNSADSSGQINTDTDIDVDNTVDAGLF